jgi:DNA-directed RNA polymerase subunit L
MLMGLVGYDWAHPLLARNKRKVRINKVGRIDVRREIARMI